jgi:hypothetical protein
LIHLRLERLAAVYMSRPIDLVTPEAWTLFRRRIRRRHINIFYICGGGHMWSIILRFSKWFMQIQTDANDRSRVGTIQRAKSKSIIRVRICILRGPGASYMYVGTSHRNVRQFSFTVARVYVRQIIGASTISGWNCDPQTCAYVLMSRTFS